MEVERIVEGFKKGDITFKKGDLRMRKIERRKR
jgi:hypothetical protein